MKIRSIKTFVYRAHFNWIFVKIETDEGVSGWGEATMQGAGKTVEAAVHEVGENYLIGKDPRQIELHVSTMLRNSYWRPSVVLYTAISGLEIGMWDILGKTLNVPIYNLLGGVVNSRLKTYHNGWWFEAKTPLDLGRLAKDCVTKMGAKAIKLDPMLGCDCFVDRGQVKRIKETMRLVREAVGDDVDILVDLHGRLSPDNAIRVGRELEDYRPYWWEEPIPSDAGLDDLAMVASSINTPVCVGERLYSRWGFRDLFEKRAAPIINPDIMHQGGILETKKVADMAHAYYVSVSPHSSGGPILTAASLQLEAVIPNFLIHEFFSIDIPYYKEIVKEQFPIMKDGFVELPCKPGLGVELDEEALSNRPYKYFDFGGLWASYDDFKKTTKVDTRK